MLYNNYSTNEKGHFCLGGADTVDLAEKYGTPLYLMDENAVRHQCRRYVKSMNEYFRAGSMPIYASKANSFKKIYKIIDSENMGADVVSPGEIYTALQAGFPAEKMFFHGNVKSPKDIKFAIDNKVGYFIVDNYDELKKIEKCAGEAGICQKVLLRITPGIDPHTFAAVNTGKVDSKFGTPIATGQAKELVGQALETKNIELCGYHCHIGSQIFDQVPFCDAVDIMVEFIADMKDAYGYEAKMLNLGGGFGVKYVDSHPYCTIEENIKLISEHLNAQCEKFGIQQPIILMEPGRSIVGGAGVTMYSVESVKSITGYKNYVAIDGGMTDNPRFALYGAEYTVLVADRADREGDFPCSVVGRCCESGDIIQENVMLQAPQVGDYVAVLVTGAYNYSMASHYNTVPLPPVVLVKDGKDELAVRRETFEDVISCQL